MSRFTEDLIARAKQFVNTPKQEVTTVLQDAVQEPKAAMPVEPTRKPMVQRKQESDTQDAMSIVIGLCKHFEGLYLKPYLCSANVPTIGYGATFYEDGTRVTLKDPAITKQRAEQLLRWHVSRYFMPDVIRMCPGANTPGRIAAICDLAFNIGLGNLKNSTLRRKVNAGAWDEVPTQFLRWNKAGGKVLRGLTRRRQAEIEFV